MGSSGNSQLRVLVYHCHSFDLAHVVKAASRHVQLRELHIVNHVLQEETLPSDLLSCLARCQEMWILNLKLRAPLRFKDSDVERLASELPHLTEFTVLADESELTLRALVMIARPCPSIGKIVLEVDPKRGLEAVIDFPPRRTLDRVELHWGDILTQTEQRATAAFVRSISSSEKITFWRGPDLDEESSTSDSDEGY